MNFGLFHSIWTVLLMALFIGIVAWAFSRKRKRRFDAAARMPLEDDDAASPSGEKKHGEQKHG